MIIKVCGMREPENIRAVAQLDIDWMGFIFYPKSPRCAIDNSQLTIDNWASRSVKNNCQLSIVNCQLKKVGVFVNASPLTIQETALRYRLDYLQLHGGETPDECYALRKRGYALIKALPVSRAEDLRAAAAYEGVVDYLLFDTRCEGYGGSGQAFDWSLLEGYQGETSFLLSGGLRPESAEALLRFHHPRLAGIDLNSGFETAPGVKDIARLKAFIQKIRNKKIG